MVLEASEPESPGSSQSLKTKQVRRGTHSVSESSVTLSKSSPVVAEGQFISPNRAEQVQSHDEPVCSLGTGTHEEDEGEDEGLVIVHEGDHPERSDKQDHLPNREHPGHEKKMVVEATLRLIDEDHAIPAIEATPPTPGMTLPDGLDSLQQASSSDGVKPMALPADPPTIVAAPAADAEAPPTAISDAAGPDLPTSVTGQHNHLNGRERANKTKKRRVVGKARRVILRKKVLSMILGRQLAGTVHPLLQASSGG
ncbi:hypothetical protein DV736_g190, partial [Chaetothyriales sp. CBS 134916]